jgi:RNA polymerase sigma factor (TIGR02999 family)
MSPDGPTNHDPTHDVTLLLAAITRGQRSAEDLLPRLYGELRKLAAARLSAEAPGNTLQPTALVHEAYLRLLGPRGEALQWDSRAHFFAAAAEAMRRILIDRARSRRALKRAGPPGGKKIEGARLEELISLDGDPDMILDLDAALTALEAEDEAKARLVKLRFYAGLTLEQAARALGISAATADRHWAFARAWLFVRVSGGDHGKNTEQPDGKK